VDLRLLEIEALTSEIPEARLRLVELIAALRKRQPTIRLRMENLREHIERVPNSSACSPRSVAGSRRCFAETGPLEGTDEPAVGSYATEAAISR
jgi:hypothetical protein